MVLYRQLNACQMVSRDRVLHVTFHINFFKFFILLHFTYHTHLTTFNGEIKLIKYQSFKFNFQIMSKLETLKKIKK